MTALGLLRLPVWLSCEVLRLLRDMPTMACILAPMLERRFLSSVPTVPTAVSDWLPSVFSRLHMSPLTLVLLVMLTPPDEPICLFFILDAKSLVSRDAIESLEEVEEEGGGVEERRECWGRARTGGRGEGSEGERERGERESQEGGSGVKTE